MSPASSVDPRLARDQAALAALIMGRDGGGGALGLLRPLRGAAPLVSVYQTAWHARLTEALRSNYPVLHQVLGDDDFAALCAAFRELHPPMRPSIRWFGEHLPGFLAGHPELMPHPALADLARMEWALGASFDSADSAPLDTTALMAMPAASWPDLRLKAHPSVSLLQMAWAVEPLWKTLTRDPGTEAEAPEEAAHALLVWRQGLETRWRSLEHAEAELLEIALQGEPFSALCAHAAAHDMQTDVEAAAMRVAGSLRAWVEAGLVCLADEA